MNFDNPTLFKLLWVEGIAAALVMAVLIGRHGSPAARWAQAGMALQALGWLLLAATGGARNLPLLTAALCAFSAAVSALWMAVQHWLPSPRLGRRLMMIAPLLLPLIYALLPDDGRLRTGSAHMLLALQLMLFVCAVTVPPRDLPAGAVQRDNARRWRALMLAAVLPLAIVCLLRGGMAINGPEPLDLFSTDGINTALALTAQLMLSLMLPALLLAWRGETEAELAGLAHTDGLTGLADRRAFAARAVDMISMARRHQEPLALMVLDIDFLRTINAEHGHDAGDRALAWFASCVQAQLRLGDLAGRVGGEEFAVLMARCEALGPQAMDKRLREAVAARAAAELGFALNFSAGWAKLRHGDRHLDDLMRRADTALYEAKRGGRGCLVAEPGLET